MLQSKDVLLAISYSLMTTLLFRVDLQFLLSYNRLSECILLICQGNLKLYSNQISREKRLSGVLLKNHTIMLI